MRITGDADRLTRRQLLIASGVVGGTGLLAGAASIGFGELMDAARTDPLDDGQRVLVLVTLYGGNDGLNTVVPVEDAVYQDQRPDLAYAPSETLPLADGLALNPALKGLKQSWDSKQLAVVRGVGYPGPDRSHFRSMDIWQTANPDEPVNTGWIGRWLDATGDDPLRAVNIGSVLPPLAVGAKATAAALDLREGGKARPVVANALTGLAASDPGDTPAELMVARSCSAQLEVSKALSPVLAANADHDEDPSSPAGSGGGQTDLGRQLDIVARCIKAGVPTRVYTVSLGGFDTHAAEKQTQQAALDTLDKALGSFWSALGKDPSKDGVVVAVYSEFGRRVAANASDGTDHGTAGPVLVSGPSVTGGFYGDEPSLTDLDDGDLKMTTDFRQVYAELARGVLDTDPARILGRDWDPLGFLSA